MEFNTLKPQIASHIIIITLKTKLLNVSTVGHISDITQVKMGNPVRGHSTILTVQSKMNTIQCNLPPPLR